MSAGILGLPLSGKSKLYMLLTNCSQDKHTSFDPSAPNTGIIEVPDNRVNQLSNLYASKKTTYTHIELIEFGSLMGNEKKAPTIHPRARELDTILLAIRCFERDSVPHSKLTVNPIRDLEELLNDLLLSDLQIIENRLPKLEVSIQRESKEKKEYYIKEKELLLKIQAHLESNGLQKIIFPEHELQYIKGFGFFLLKNLLVVANVGDLTNNRDTDYFESLQEFCAKHKINFTWCNLEIELEVSSMPQDEGKQFLSMMGLSEGGRERIIKDIYKANNYITFFTAGEKETKAYPIPQGTTCVKASGLIHSDIERGFIRAEVVSCDNLIKHGSLKDCQNAGVIRTEGKDYIVQEGDVMLIRFSV